MSYVLRFRTSREYPDMHGRGAWRRLYATLLIDPRSHPRSVFPPHAPDTRRGRGWVLALQRPFDTEREREYAADMGAPATAYLLSFFAREFMLGTGGLVADAPRSNDPDNSRVINGWVDPPSGRLYFSDRTLKRAGVDVAILLTEVALPFAMKRPPFTRPRKP